MVDELGHRRVVHYSAGKSSQRERIPKRISDSVTSSPPRRTPEEIVDTVSLNSRYVENQNTNLVPPPLYTSSMASLELINRLVPKPSTTPVYKNAEESVQRMSIVTPLNNVLGARNKVLVSRNNVRTNVDGERHNIRDTLRSVRYASSSIRNARNFAYDSRKNKNTASNNVHEALINVPDSQSLTSALHSQIKNARSMQNYYQASNVHSTSDAATKSLLELTNRKHKNTNQRNMGVPVYDPKVENEYYDTTPELLNIERVSYNIGTGRKSSFKL